MSIGLQAYLQGYMHEKTAAPLKDQTVSTPWTKIDAGEVPSGESLAFWRTDAVKGKKMSGFKRQPDPRPETLDIADLARTKGEPQPQGGQSINPLMGTQVTSGLGGLIPLDNGKLRTEDVSTDPWGMGIKGRIPGDTAFENATVHKKMDGKDDGMSLADLLRSAADVKQPGMVGGTSEATRGTGNVFPGSLQDPRGTYRPEK